MIRRGLRQLRRSTNSVASRVWEFSALSVRATSRCVLCVVPRRRVSIRVLDALIAGARAVGLARLDLWCSLHPSRIHARLACMACKV